MSNELGIVVNPDARVWDDFVASRGGHVFQTTAWGELKTRFGWSALVLALARGDAPIAGAQVLFRQLPLGLRFAYIPRGPVVDPNDRVAFAALLDALCAAVKSRGAFALKIEPNWLDAPISNLQFLPSNSIQPRTTIHLDLTRGLDAILAQMKPKWRYNIRLAERKGVTVREGSADDLPTFYRLMQITRARDRFAIHSADYYRAAFELFTARDYARLFVAEYAREPLAAIFVTAFGGEAIYLYGASSNAHRERMPNHALHWAAIQWAKARGCVRYDLWGVAAVADALVGERHARDQSDLSNVSSLPHGLYQFKQGFGGQLVQYTGGYDAVFSRWRHALYVRALAWRRGALG
jgi:lipid II:glycine glycyltransferase (peptidoglycan interpeptide bridge formation enzyme)